MKKKEKKYGLLKGILLFIFIAIVLSWLIPNGQYSGTGLVTENALVRVGLTDLSWLAYYGFYFALDKIVLLLAIGGFYGVLSKTSAYNRLVSGIASRFQHQRIVVVVFSIIIAALASLFTQTFVVVLFIPFIVSIMNRMKLDKMTILATTFGSILVGVLGATYGTEGLIYLNRYLTSESFDPKSTVLIRAGILLIGLVLFNFFTLTHMKKVEKNAKGATMFDEEVEEVNEKKKDNNRKEKPNYLPIKVVGAIVLVVLIALIIFAGLGWINWSTVLTLAVVAVVLLLVTFCFIRYGNITALVFFGLLLLIISILGFVDWSNFNITCFDKFHETVYDIHIGTDFYVFKSILGSNLSAFGSWDVFSIASVIFVFTIILGLCYRVKFNDFISGYALGMKKMIKPCLVVAAAFALMVVVYMSPYVATIMDKLLSLTDGFNVVTMSLSAFIANIFHTDLGFTGYIAGSYLVTEYVDHINPVYVIFTSLYGFVQFFIPTSIVLGIGLTTLDVKYRDWLKHIWKFLIGMIICLLVIFLLMAMI